MAKVWKKLQRADSPYTGDVTGSINGASAADIKSGSAKGASSNQDSTSTIRSGTTAANVGLGNVPNYSAATMRSGVTSSDVGLGNVANETRATILGGVFTGNVTGTVDGEAASSIKTKATAGSAAKNAVDGNASVTMVGGSINIGSGEWTVDSSGNQVTKGTITINKDSGGSAGLTLDSGSSGDMTLLMEGANPDVNIGGTSPLGTSSVRIKRGGTSNQCRLVFYNGGSTVIGTLGYANMPSAHTTQLAMHSGVIYDNSSPYFERDFSIDADHKVGFWANDKSFAGVTIGSDGTNKGLYVKNGGVGIGETNTADGTLTTSGNATFGGNVTFEGNIVGTPISLVPVGDGPEPGAVYINGSLGIGLDDPESSLEIHDGNLVIGSGNTRRITLEGDSSYPLLKLEASNGGKVVLKSFGDSYFSGGNVGIGADTSPNYKLDVQGTFRADSDASFGGDITVEGGDITLKTGIKSISNAANAQFLIIGDVDEDETIQTIKLTTMADEGFIFISEDGIGINDSSPSYKLDVNGTFRTTGAATFDNNVTWSGGGSTESNDAYDKMGWHGSPSRIKMIPSDFMPNDDSTTYNLGVVDSGGKIKAMSSSLEAYGMYPIPQGFKATHVRTYGSDSLNNVNVYEGYITTANTTSKGSGKIGNNIDITDVTGTSSNYLIVKWSPTSTSDYFYGGYITIART